MSPSYNGGNKKRKKLRTSSSENTECLGSPNFAEASNLAASGFRGFEKVPVVVVARHDITPFLESGKYILGSQFESVFVPESPFLLSQFQKECKVNIFRDDLEKLKAALPKVYASRSLADTAAGARDSENSPSTSDMANLQCNICEKTYSSEKKLQNHQENKHIILKPDNNKTPKRVSFSDHVIIHEVTEYHKCRKCTKIFENYKSLKIHMKKQHKKRKCYICNYCHKKFVDRMFFKVHIRLHCDVCGLLLPSRSQYIEHKRNICRVLKMHKCKDCNISFFKLMDLRDHSYDHLDSSHLICDICKDQCQTKCQLAHHLAYLHSKKRPSDQFSIRNLGSERLYLCNFCTESSVERDIIDKHLELLPDLTNKAMTGYKDYYFCDQCLRKFATEQDMLQHKWTHFLKTSDNCQIRPKSILLSILSKPIEVQPVYRVGDKLPEKFNPKVLLEKIKLPAPKPKPREYADFLDLARFDILNGVIKKPIVDPKSKKTLLSRHQCQQCSKYFSTNYCLNRHMQTMHADYENLRCKVCEETFVWPSLLQSHRCIRLNLPEIPFDDARPEIQITNLEEAGIEEMNLSEDDAYMHSVDFEIPAPIVELTECSGQYVSNSAGDNVRVHYEGVEKSCADRVSDIGYRLIMQEVPIEF